MKALNASKSIIVAENLKEASDFASRLKGLIGRERLEDGEGLWITPCGAIHTFGMRFPIDVVFLDGNLMVKKIVKAISPFRATASLSTTQGVIELPAGTIERAQIEVGDRIEIAS